MTRTKPCARMTCTKPPLCCTCRLPCCAVTRGKGVSKRRSPASAGSSSKRILLTISVSFTLADGKRR